MLQSDSKMDRTVMGDNCQNENSGSVGSLFTEMWGRGGGELSWFAHQVEQCMLLSDGQKGCAICERLRTEVRR